MKKHYSDRLNKALKRAHEQEHLATIVVIARILLRENPNDSTLLVRYGYALAQMARYEEAEEILNQALANISYDRMYLVYLKIGDIYKFQNKYKEACEWYQRVVDARPFDADGYTRIAGTYARQGMFQEAENVYRSGIECEEGCMDELYYNLGTVLLGQDKLLEAEEFFEKALQIDPEYKIAKRRLADAKEALRIQAEFSE